MKVMAFQGKYLFHKKNMRQNKTHTLLLLQEQILVMNDLDIEIKIECFEHSCGTTSKILTSITKINTTKINK